jgi:hypothetical protein
MGSSSGQDQFKVSNLIVIYICFCRQLLHDPHVEFQNNLHLIYYLPCWFVFCRLGLDKISLEEVEKEAEVALAKTEISAFRAQTIEIMESHKQRYGLVSTISTLFLNSQENLVSKDILRFCFYNNRVTKKLFFLFLIWQRWTRSHQN